MENIGVYLIFVAAIATLAVVIIWLFRVMKWLKDFRFTKEYFEEKGIIPPNGEVGPKEVLGEENEEEVQE